MGPARNAVTAQGGRRPVSQLRYRKFRRKTGVYYAEDTVTAKQFSLRTHDEAEAELKIHALCEAARNSMFNRQLGMIYLAGVDPKLASRIWQEVMDQYCAREMRDTSRMRAQRAFASAAFNPIRKLCVNEARPEDFQAVIKGPKRQAALNYARRLHNFAQGMGWLVMPIMTKALWPKAQPQIRRAITAEEHAAILASEGNPERRAYYDVIWMTGGSQSDIAGLTRENVDAELSLMIYQRLKLPGDAPASRLRIGPRLAALLQALPKTGPLFPTIVTSGANARATEFRRRCRIAGIKGVSLHSYRYAWAERAAASGYPERFAMQSLGHSSKAVHRAYSRRANPDMPSLEDYAAPTGRSNVVLFPAATDGSQENALVKEAQAMIAKNPQFAEAIIALGAAAAMTARVSTPKSA